ncbi:MAG: hypothetical protein K2X00_09815 [Nitrospiraceae bacterium]|nr:hypothetical protein [Nitrospiraceae bacterium]
MTNDCRALTVVEATPYKQTTFWLDADLTYRDGVTTVPALAVFPIRLSLYVRDTPAQEAINSLTNTEILNTSRCLLDVASGRLTIRLDSADLVILNPDWPQEWHEALVQLTLTDGAVLYHVVQFAVLNHAKIA